MNHEKEINCLKKVFTYGNATDTHIDILGYLYSIGISKDEYSKWGRNEEE